MAFGARLRAIRETRLLEQGELADLVGVDKATVFRWEDGRSEPALRTLRRIASALAVSADDLLDTDGQLPPAPDTSLDALLLQMTRHLRKMRRRVQELDSEAA